MGTFGTGKTTIALIEGIVSSLFSPYKEVPQHPFFLSLLVLLFSRQKWKSQEERGTGSLRRFKPEMTPVLFDQFAAEIQSQARSANAPGRGVISAHKTSEYLGMLPLRNPYALILHADLNHRLGHSWPDSNDNGSPFRAVLNGITDQIDQYLLYSTWIDIRNQRDVVRIYCYTVSCGSLLQVGDHTACQRHYIGGYAVQEHPPRLQSRDIQEFVSQLGKAGGSLVNLHQRFLLPIGQLRPVPASGLHQQHVGKSSQGGQRRAQFVRHNTDEFVFEIFRFLKSGNILIDDQGYRLWR